MGNKKRVSLTLDEELVERLDSLVDGVVIQSRSQAVERFLKDRLRNRKTAVILGGGSPEDMKMGDTYRPLVEVNGKKLIEHIVLNAREAGYHNQIFVGHPEVVSSVYSVLGNGNDHDVTMTYVEDPEPRGSAKTLEKVKEHIETDFLLVPADHYFEFDLEKIREFHEKNDGEVTLAVHTRADYSWDLGIVEMDGNRITAYHEDPDDPKTNLHSTLIGFFSKSIFDNIPPGDVSWSLQTDVFPQLAEEGKLLGYPTSGKWANVHTEEDLEAI